MGCLQYDLVWSGLMFSPDPALTLTYQYNLERKDTTMEAEVLLETVPPVRILLVDDSDLFRRIVQRMLKTFPSFHLVGEAVDGLSAVEMAIALCPDIIVMDVQMPGLNGIEATRRIKARLPQVSVIGLSAMDDRMIHNAMRAAGASAFVPKHRASSLPQVIEDITNDASHHSSLQASGMGPHARQK